MICGRNAESDYCFLHKKRKPISKITKNKKEEASEGNIKEFFMQIWRERPHVCFETGVRIKGEPLTTMFHHVLKKSVFPQYKYSEWNIVILLPEVHEQVELNIEETPKVKKLTEELLEVHKDLVNL